jgi:hypothetical protein
MNFSPSGDRHAGGAGSDVTIIQCSPDPINEHPIGGTTVTCSNVGGSTIVEGFTITGGHLRGGTGLCCGSGLSLDNSDVIVRNNIITGNSAGWPGGGGITVAGGAPTISGNTISHNASPGQGGGIYCSGNPLIIQDVIVDNSDGGFAGGPVGVGHGGGIFVASGSAQISECTIVGNQADIGAGILVNYYASLTLSRSIVAFNTQRSSGPGNGVELADGASIAVTCSNVFGNSGSSFGGMTDPTGTNGNQSLDPLFCDLNARDLTISTFSPSAPAHSPSGCDLVGALPPSCAAVPAVRSTWGKLKARYR